MSEFAKAIDEKAAPPAKKEKPPIPSVATIKADLNARVQRVVSERFAEGEIEDAVSRVIDRSMEGMIAGALGFRKDTCNGWEVNSWSNGHELPAHQRLVAAAEKRVMEALSDLTVPVDKILPKNWKEAARKDYERALRQKLKEKIEEAVERYADAEAARLVAEALGERL